MHPQASSLLCLTLAALHLQQSLASPLPHPERHGAVSTHGIGHPGNYDLHGAYGAHDDADLQQFNAVVYGPDDPQWRAPSPQYTAEQRALLGAVPSKIAKSPAIRGFDEDLAILAPPAPAVYPASAEYLGHEHQQPPLTPEQQRNNPTVSVNEIPACEIAAEFPEYREPKTFSTERVDYNLRTQGPGASGPGGEQQAQSEGGEENSNVAVFSTDKAFHWSGGNGEALPKNDPEFKEALNWISGKFRPAGKPRGKGRARKDSVFEILGGVV